MTNYQLKKNQYFNQLESLRGIAAILVVFFHCDYFFPPVKYIMLLNKGYLFVDLFFVLSGFVIYINYYNKLNNFRKFKEFIILRLGRIYPLHILTTLLFLLVPIIEYLTNDYGIGKSNISLLNILSNLFLIQAWGFNDFYSLNAASWSISTEFFAYLLFGFLLIFFRKFSQVIFFLLIVAFIPILLNMDFKANYFAAIARCVYSFSIGVSLCYTYLKYSEKTLKKYTPRPIYIVTALFFFIEIVLRFWDNYEYIIFPLMSAILILSLIIHPNDEFTNKLYNPILFKIGTLSYTIYMIHGLVITFYLRIFRHFKIDYLKLELKSVMYSFVLMIIIFSSLFFISNLIYNKYEKPIRDRVRKIIQN
jgi:peptidoglycan/LPS O-acetylase OafA/YrhL